MIAIVGAGAAGLATAIFAARRGATGPIRRRDPAAHGGARARRRGRPRGAPQLPLTLSEDSEPEPDLAVVRASDAPLEGLHPRSALLVIEVAGDSLRFDRQSKRVLYAGAGIPEYWIVNLAEAAIEAHSDPDPVTGLYRSSAVVRAGETVVSRTLPDLAIDVARLFG
jgi:Uma2 family endonuclease